MKEAMKKAGTTVRKDIESSGESSGGGTSVKTYTVRIPESANDVVQVEIIANGQTVHSGTHSKSEQYVSVEIEGSGTIEVQALIDGALADQKQLTF